MNLAHQTQKSKPVMINQALHQERTPPADRHHSAVIDFASHVPSRAARPSPVQKLCASYEKTLAAFKAALDAHAKAERLEKRGRERADGLIRPTKRNLADVGANIEDGGNRVPIRSAEIRRAIKALKASDTEVDRTREVTTTSLARTPSPLTRQQLAQLTRLEARLPIALAYEATCAERTKEVEKLNRATYSPMDRLGSLMSKLVNLPSHTRDDLLAKARIYELDADQAEDGLGVSIAQDIARLAASGAI